MGRGVGIVITIGVAALLLNSGLGYPSQTHASIRSLSGRSSRVRTFINTAPQAQSGDDSYCVAVLGDLHLHPEYMQDHHEAREHIQRVFESSSKGKHSPKQLLVSLGDLGTSKPLSAGLPLYSGTSKCFNNARSYLDSFGVPHLVVAGNHDLEGLDEFETDAENLQAFVKNMGTYTHYWAREVAPKTICIGLSTTRFRDSPSSSHEVFIDKPQLDWFQYTLAQYPAEAGFRVFVFTHAPPMGSGLRVLQNVHVKNGCAWLNHAETPEMRRIFCELTKEHKCIKAWFSGHFHLSHEYEDSITVPEPGGCVFVQTGVIGTPSSRDGFRQSRIITGSENQFTISTVQHHKGGDLRLDATVTYDDDTHESIFYAHSYTEDVNRHNEWFRAETPSPNDGCYINTADGFVSATQSSKGAVCWWHMADGAVLGVHDGQIVQYDELTLAPLGIVCDKATLNGREVAVITDQGTQALVLCDDKQVCEVLHPNQDGSYVKFSQQNKKIRELQKRREAVARQWFEGSSNN